MHVGYSAFFQNLSGQHTDEEVYRHELALVDLAEPLGFDSVWSPEHHFTNYVMVPNPAQFLTWVAGRTVKQGCTAIRPFPSRSFRCRRRTRRDGARHPSGR